MGEKKGNYFELSVRAEKKNWNKNINSKKKSNENS